MSTHTRVPAALLAVVVAATPVLAEPSADDALLLEAPPPALTPFVARPTKPAALLERARAYTDTPWIFSGRSKRGLDCVGLVFTAFAETYGVRRKAYDRHNSRNAEVIARIGTVAALLPASRFAADAPTPTEIQPGDVLAFLWASPNPVEPAYARRGDTKLWIWHVGLAVDAKTLLHAGPWAGRTQEEPLAGFVRDQAFLGVVVVRPGAPVTPKPGK